MNTPSQTVEQRREQLITEWADYCRAQSIPHTSMGDVDTDTLTSDQQEAVLDFQMEWDANEERGRDEREEACLKADDNA